MFFFLYSPWEMSAETLLCQDFEESGEWVPTNDKEWSADYN